MDKTENYAKIAKEFVGSFLQKTKFNDLSDEDISELVRHRVIRLQLDWLEIEKVLKSGPRMGRTRDQSAEI